LERSRWPKVIRRWRCADDEMTLTPLFSSTARCLVGAVLIVTVWLVAVTIAALLTVRWLDP
jgi:hypothetical protein